MKIHEIQTGDISPGNAKFAIVAARFNSDIVNNLLKGTLNTLESNSVKDENVETIFVPGAYELPIAAKKLVETKKYSAIITLGCVIRGDTPHFDFVAGECARGVMEVGLDSGIPVIFGVLTTDTVQQAQLRSQINGDNKGVDCALCALEMSNVMNQIRDLP